MPRGHQGGSRQRKITDIDLGGPLHRRRHERPLRAKADITHDPDLRAFLPEGERLPLLLVLGGAHRRAGDSARARAAFCDAAAGTELMGRERQAATRAGQSDRESRDPPRYAQPQRLRQPPGRAALRAGGGVSAPRSRTHRPARGRDRLAQDDARGRGGSRRPLPTWRIDGRARADGRHEGDPRRRPHTPGVLGALTAGHIVSPKFTPSRREGRERAQGRWLARAGALIAFVSGGACPYRPRGRGTTLRDGGVGRSGRPMMVTAWERSDTRCAPESTPSAGGSRPGTLTPPNTFRRRTASRKSHTTAAGPCSCTRRWSGRKHTSCRWSTRPRHRTRGRRCRAEATWWSWSERSSWRSIPTCSSTWSSW